MVSKESNKNAVITYLIIAFILFFFGLYTKRPEPFFIATIMLLLAFFRKYWLSNRLES